MLIECPDCNKEVSDKAKACPNCGYPISVYLEKRNNEDINDKIVQLKRNDIENGDFNAVRIAIERGADISKLDDGSSPLMVCAIVYSAYENGIARNQNINRSKFDEWKNNILSIADKIIDTLNEKDKDINLMELSQKSPTIFSRCIKNMSAEEQLNIIRSLKPDIIFHIFEEIGYFPLIDSIDKNTAKEVLYRMSIQQRGPIIQKMKDPPEMRTNSENDDHVKNENAEIKQKPKFEMLVLLMFIFFILQVGFINVPLGHYTINKIKKSNGTLSGLGLSKLFLFMGYVFLVGIIIYLILMAFKIAI